MKRVPVGSFKTAEVAEEACKKLSTNYSICHKYVCEGKVVFGYYDFVSDPFKTEIKAQQLKWRKEDKEEKNASKRMLYEVIENTQNGKFYVVGSEKKVS